MVGNCQRGGDRKDGIEAIYRKPDTSKRHPGHKIYPYLLRGLKIDRPNQVWALDISAPCRRGLQRQEKGGKTVSEPKLADSRPAAAMLPRTGGGRAKGGCKARPFADGGVSCAEQPELYRARSRSGCESGYRKVYGETTKCALEASVYSDTPSL